MSTSKESNPNETSNKKSTSPFMKNAWNDTTNASDTTSIPIPLQTTNSTMQSTFNEPTTENTNPNALCTDNERLLMLQRFATNNYCSSDDSEDSYGTESKGTNH